MDERQELPDSWYLNNSDQDKRKENYPKAFYITLLTPSSKVKETSSNCVGIAHCEKS